MGFARISKSSGRSVPHTTENGSSVAGSSAFPPEGVANVYQIYVAQIVKMVDG